MDSTMVYAHEARDNTPSYSSRGTHVPFGTATDALLAKLFLTLKSTYDVSRITLDTIIDTLLDPSFDATQISFRSSFDVDLYMSEQRQRQMDLICTSTKSAGTPRVPLIALDEIVDMFRDDIGPLQLVDTPSGMISVGGQSHQALKSMSLVHRSWTAIAQRVLRRRAIVTSVGQADAFLCSPYCSPCLRELVIDIGGGDHKLQMWMLCAEIIRRVPNLQKLYVKVKGRSPTRTGFATCLARIGELKDLRCLWMMGFDSPNDDSCLEVIRMLPRLERLEDLYLDSSLWLQREAFPSSAFELPLSGCLKTMSIPYDTRSNNEQLSSWLLRPKEKRSIQNLVINFPDAQVVYASTIVDQYLPFVTTLVVTYDNCYGIGPPRVPPLLNMFRMATGLRRFSVNMPKVDGMISTLSLPTSVEQLHIHFTDRKEILDEENRYYADKLISCLLKNGHSSSKLHRLIITYSRAGKGDGRLTFIKSNVTGALPKISKFCWDNGIQLDIGCLLPAKSRYVWELVWDATL
ncbi:hypothetical protein DFH11DRAFT_1747025 [Phellopilus nigrolimitatus]|nr:hypothetical protein DFH11DRAFT_1747025 [Phellopilus nigrolimitatus]